METNQYLSARCKENKLREIYAILIKRRFILKKYDLSSYKIINLVKNYEMNTDWKLIKQEKSIYELKGILIINKKTNDEICLIEVDHTNTISE